MIATQIDRRLAAAAIGVLVALRLARLSACAGLLALRHFEHQRRLAGFEAMTRTSLGLPGDAINVGLEGRSDDVLCAMQAAGWRPADPVTLSSSARIIGSVLLDRPYSTRRSAPSSTTASSIGLSESVRRERQHAPSRALLEGARRRRGGPAGVARRGAFDHGVGVSHYTGQVTHHTAPDIDAERDLLSVDLARGVVVASAISSAASDRRCSPAMAAAIAISLTVKSRFQGSSPVRCCGGAPRRRRPSPPKVAAKNAVFAALGELFQFVSATAPLARSRVGGLRPTCSDVPSQRSYVLP